MSRKYVPIFILVYVVFKKNLIQLYKFTISLSFGRDRKPRSRVKRMLRLWHVKDPRQSSLRVGPWAAASAKLSMDVKQSINQPLCSYATCDCVFRMDSVVSYIVSPSQLQFDLNVEIAYDPLTIDLTFVKMFAGIV